MKIKVDGLFYEVSNMAKVGFGAQGIIVRVNSSGRAVKLFHTIDDETVEKLRNCIVHGAYEEPIKDIATVPLSLVYNEGSRVVGYTMRYLNGFTSVAEMSDMGYCQRNRISLKRIVALFYVLHESLETIHSYGFLVGDLRENNIQFKPPNNGRWQIAFMDVDSWAVRQPGFKFPCTALHPSTMHPELRAKSEYSSLKARHDWYAFAVTFASCLLKCNPFEEGYHPEYRDEARRINGITCWDPNVLLTPTEKVSDFRISNRIIQVFKNWLSGKEAGTFPKTEIFELYDYLESTGKASLI